MFNFAAYKAWVHEQLSNKKHLQAQQTLEERKHISCWGESFSFVSLKSPIAYFPTIYYRRKTQYVTTEVSPGSFLSHVSSYSTFPKIPTPALCSVLSHKGKLSFFWPISRNIFTFFLTLIGSVPEEDLGVTGQSLRGCIWHDWLLMQRYNWCVHISLKDWIGFGRRKRESEREREKWESLPQNWTMKCPTEYHAFSLIPLTPNVGLILIKP